VEAVSEADALQKVEKACKELLSNPIMEGFQIEITAN
jgi:phosphoribosylformylglycinamidine (FGAM) synthase PurS component